MSIRNPRGVSRLPWIMLSLLLLLGILVTFAYAGEKEPSGVISDPVQEIDVLVAARSERIGRLQEIGDAGTQEADAMKAALERQLDWFDQRISEECVEAGDAAPDECAEFKQ